MNIMFVEDQGGVFDYLIEDLQDEGHSVFVAENISKAKTYWHSEKIDCIVVDLNMRPDGLSDEQREETHGGLLSGWVWLKYYVFAEQPVMKRQTIVVTAYLDELKRILGEAELKGMRVVPKRRHGTPESEVASHIKAMGRELADGNAIRES